jgi:AbiV family abortive infection protein
MTQPVTSEYVLEGAAYALEQCGLLLRDANTLYRAKAYASAVALAAFAREELGRWRVLLDLRREAIGGRQLTVEDVKDRCGNHVVKQKAAMLSITMRTDKESGLGKLLNARSNAKPGSNERKAADKQVKDIDDKMEKRVPGDRHVQRMSALYVDPISSTTEWNRPSANETQETAHNSIVDTVNEYSGQVERYSHPEIIKPDDPELYEALMKWTRRPVMPEPEWPAFPATENAPKINSGGEIRMQERVGRVAFWCISIVLAALFVTTVYFAFSHPTSVGRPF